MFKLCRLILIAVVALCVYCAVLLGEIFGGAMVALVVIGGIAWAAKRGRTLTAFGTARWANADDLRNAGMLGGQGLIVGRLLNSQRPPLLPAVLGLVSPRVKSADACDVFFRAIFRKPGGNSPMVRLSRSVHSAIFASTGAGKNVSCVFPFLLSCQDSCVTVDFKGENYRVSAERRRQMGHQIVALDPWHLVTDGHATSTYNPLDFIDKDSPQAVDEIRDLAEALVIRTGKEMDPHWNDSAETVIATAIAAVVLYGDSDDRSLQTVRNLIADPQRMEQVGMLLRGSNAWDGLASRMGHQLSHFQDKERASVMTTASRNLKFLDSPAVVASTRTSNFDPAQLRSGKMSIFLVVPLEHARTQAGGLLRMWIGSILHAVVRGGLQK